MERRYYDLEPACGIVMGEYFRQVLDESARSPDLKLEAIKVGQPGNTTIQR